MVQRYTPTHYTVRLNRFTQFPLDMLRYADSEGSDVENKALIDRLACDLLTDDKADLPKEVEVQLFARYGLTSGAIQRWRSFGVDVISADDPATAAIAKYVQEPNFVKSHRDPISPEVLTDLRFARNAYLSSVADWRSSGEPKTGRAAYNLKHTQAAYEALLLEHGAALIEEVLQLRGVI